MCNILFSHIHFGLFVFSTKLTYLDIYTRIQDIFSFSFLVLIQKSIVYINDKMVTHPRLEYDILYLLVGCIHDSPTEEGAPTINTDSFVNVLQLVSPLPVDFLKHIHEIHIRPTTTALDVDLDDIHRVEYCAYHCSYDSTG